MAAITEERDGRHAFSTFSATPQVGTETQRTTVEDSQRSTKLEESNHPITQPNPIRPFSLCNIGPASVVHVAVIVCNMDNFMQGDVHRQYTAAAIIGMAFRAFSSFI